MNFKYTIKNPNGVHFRPAGYLASLASKYNKCKIKLSKVFENVLKTDNLENLNNSTKINVSEQLSSSCVSNKIFNLEKINNFNFLDASQILSITGLGLKKGDEVFFSITGPDEQTEHEVKNELYNLLAEHF